VDLAVESGGNVEGSEEGKEVEVGGARVVGLANLPARAAVNASQMYSNNLYGLIEDFWNKDTKAFALKLDDEIIRGCLVTHGGEVCHERIRELMGE
jgi:NAD(P) transhydrogenase subunit alpha